MFGHSVREAPRARCWHGRDWAASACEVSAPAVPMPAEACSTSARDGGWTGRRSRYGFRASVAEVRSGDPSRAPENARLALRSRVRLPRFRRFRFGQPRGQPVGGFGNDGSASEVRSASSRPGGRTGPLGRVNSLPRERSCSASPARFFGARKCREARRCRCARPRPRGRAPRHGEQLFAALSNSRVTPPSLPVASSPSSSGASRSRQLGAAVVDSLREDFEQGFERRLSARIAMTDRVKRSAPCAGCGRTSARRGP